MATVFVNNLYININVKLMCKCGLLICVDQQWGAKLIAVGEKKQREQLRMLQLHASQTCVKAWVKHVADILSTRLIKQSLEHRDALWLYAVSDLTTIDSGYDLWLAATSVSDSRTWIVLLGLSKVELRKSNFEFAFLPFWWRVNYFSKKICRVVENCQLRAWVKFQCKT